MLTLDPTNLTGEQLGTLERLTQACIDLGRADREAADLLESPGVQLHPRGATGLLKTFASDVERMGLRLSELLSAGDPEYAGTRGSFSAMAQRAWADLRAAVNGKDPYVILLEVEKAHARFAETLGEQVLAHAEDALGQTLLREYAKAAATRDRVRSLRVASREPLAS